MSDSTKDYKDEKRQMESQITESLAKICTKYAGKLADIEVLRQPDFKNGGAVWSGEIRLFITLCFYCPITEPLKTGQLSDKEDIGE